MEALTQHKDNSGHGHVVTELQHYIENKFSMKVHMKHSFRADTNAGDPIL